MLSARESYHEKGYKTRESMRPRDPITSRRVFVLGCIAIDVKHARFTQILVHPTCISDTSLNPITAHALSNIQTSRGPKRSPSLFIEFDYLSICRVMWFIFEEIVHELRHPIWKLKIALPEILWFVGTNLPPPDAIYPTRKIVSILFHHLFAL